LPAHDRDRESADDSDLKLHPPEAEAEEEVPSKEAEDLHKEEAAVKVLKRHACLFNRRKVL
jgi:hypothetical protein